jgi:uncharacterized protein
MHFAVGDLFRTTGFWSAFCAWTVASVMKMAVNLRRTRRIDFQYLVSLGGMPSAHSAMVSGLATSLGITEGFNSPVFVLALAFAFVVMFDASTVRRATGQQARLLNQIVDDLFRQHHLPENKLRELLGHTRTEVFVGMLVGITVATAVNLLVG